MLRPLIFFSLLFAALSSASAHFVFVLPLDTGEHANVVFSEDLQADKNVDIATLAGAKLFARDHAGDETALECEPEEHVCRVSLDASKTSLVYGTCEFGVTSRGNSKPFLLVYYPKSIFSQPFDPRHTLGQKVPVEIIPYGKPGEVKFQLLAEGKPIADAELTVIDPRGEQWKVKTDTDGKSPAFAALGRYGVWGRQFASVTGTHNEQPYEEIRRYPTLVVDIGNEHGQMASGIAPMPAPVSSFGAVVCEGWLYVYGGHVARTHDYSTAAVSGRFYRLHLADGRTWEELSGGPGLQGLNLATHGGKIYRVGGMEPRNKPGDETDNHSVADCAVFDPATKAWTALPPLPAPRSSHDVVVVGDKLYSIGGWHMRGKAGNDWLEAMQVLDLAADAPTWSSVKQPFERRALIAAVYRRKIYVLGGFDANDEPHLNVDIYDPTNGNWTNGPELPGGKFNGFAPAACTHGDQLYISVADGGLYRLADEGDQWQEVARTTPRIVHRLAPRGEQILVIGGASKGENFSLIEAVDLNRR